MLNSCHNIIEECCSLDQLATLFKGERRERKLILIMWGVSWVNSSKGWTTLNGSLFYQFSSKVIYLKATHKDRVVGHHFNNWMHNLCHHMHVSFHRAHDYEVGSDRTGSLTAIGDVDTGMELIYSSFQHTGPVLLTFYPH